MCVCVCVCVRVCVFVHVYQRLLITGNEKLLTVLNRINSKGLFGENSSTVKV